MPIENYVLTELLTQTAPEQIPQVPDAGIADPGFCQLTSRAQPYLEQHTFRARTTACFMSGARQDCT